MAPALGCAQLNPKLLIGTRVINPSNLHIGITAASAVTAVRKYARRELFYYRVRSWVGSSPVLDVTEIAWAYYANDDE